jgi:Holliday junction resolvase RusA-like endonuclease
MSYKYIIPAIPPSLNKFAGRNNVDEYRTLKDQWKTLVIACCSPRPKEPLSGVTVTITYYFLTRGRRDPDNYAGKMILDGLTAAGVIKDDSFDCISLVLRGDYDKQNPRTEVTIT